MLRILTLGLFISLFALALAFANDRPDFFKEEVKNPQQDECSECSKWPVSLNQELKAKAEGVQKAAHDNFTKKEIQLKKEMILFIDTNCGFSDAAVNTLVKFKKDFPDWKTTGVIISGLKGLKQKLLQKHNYFGNGIEFSIDLGAKLTRQFNIGRTPSFVISYKGRLYKVAGQPDLNEIISKLEK